MNKKPNVIIIMTDQQRADLRKSEGFKLDTTPFLDSYAKEGMDFTKAYTSMPVCAPARVSMFTGRMPSATHVRTNHNLDDAYFSKDMVDVFKENGYVTALCGKNHSHIKDTDFDYTYSFSHGGGQGADRNEDEVEFDKYLQNLQHMTDPNPAPFTAETQGPHRVVSHSIDWIDSVKDEKPFFLWLSIAEPHNPFQVPKPYYDMFSPNDLPDTITDVNTLSKKSFKYQWLRKMWEQMIPNFEESIPRTRSNYCGMLRLIDDQMARMIQYLDNNNLKEDTIVVFLSDHGDFCGEYGLIRKGPELPQVLCRIPMVFGGHEIIKNGKNSDIHASIIDIFPTLCDAIGAKIPDGVQGKSLWSVLTGQEYDRKDYDSVYFEHGFGGQYYDENDTLDPRVEGAINDGCSFDCLNSWTQAGTLRAVIKDDWKLTYDMKGIGELFNISDDYFETNNLFDDEKYRDIKSNMLELLMRKTLQINDPLPYPRNRYVFKP